MYIVYKQWGIYTIIVLGYCLHYDGSKLKTVYSGQRAAGYHVRSPSQKHISSLDSVTRNL